MFKVTEKRANSCGGQYRLFIEMDMGTKIIPPEKVKHNLIKNGKGNHSFQGSEKKNKNKPDTTKRNTWKIIFMLEKYFKLNRERSSWLKQYWF